jgi:hypothetical protein
MLVSSRRVVLAWAPRLISALEREHATLSLDCAHAMLALSAEVASKAQDAKTVITEVVKPTATAIMATATGFLANVSARHSRMQITKMLGQAVSTVKCARNQCARTSTLLTGHALWTSGAGLSARKVTS